MRLSRLPKRKGRSQANDMCVPGTHLCRKYKAHPPDSWNKWELLAITGAVVSLLYIWLYSQSFHFHVVHLYAHLGYPRAQHIVAQRYLRGAGVVKDEVKAMQWFRDLGMLLNVAVR